MLKNLKEVMMHNFYQDKGNKDLIRKINLPIYYNFTEMLDLFLEIQSGNNVPNPASVTVLCVTYSAYRNAIKKGFNALYLYDYLDFIDTDYTANRPIPATGFVLLESGDSLSFNVIQELHKQMPPETFFYVFYDNFIPKKYMSYNDIAPYHEKVYDVSRVSSDKATMNVSIRHFLNFIRQKNNGLQKIITGKNINIEKEEIQEFDLSKHLDLDKVIVTPNLTILFKLNNKIRTYLGLTNQEDPIKPNVGEWMIAERGIEVTNTQTGDKYICPIGTRFKVKECSLDRNYAYVIKFDLERPDGQIVEVLTYASKRYLEFMNTGSSELPHAPYSYCINYGYCVISAACINNEFTDGIVLFDGTLCSDKKELYMSIIPIKRSVKILYNLDNKILI